MDPARLLSIAELSRLAGITSRTLRHYESLGLIDSVRCRDTKHRAYGEQAVLRLMRILLLRDLGLPLQSIGRVLQQEADLPAGLRQHLAQLEQARAGLDRRIAAVQWTMNQLSKGEPLMAENMLDGFDHKKHQREVEARWGKEAWARWQAWWTALSPIEAQQFRAAWSDIGRGYASAIAAGETALSAAAQQVAKQHLALLSSLPPVLCNGQPDRAYLLGLADLYANDSRYVAFTGSADPDMGRYMREALLQALGDGPWEDEARCTKA